MQIDVSSEIKRLRAIGLLAVALAATSRGVEAQSVIAGGGFQRSVQRFGGDSSLNRLDGTSNGWLIVGGVRVGHLIARVEESGDSTIRNDDQTTLFVGSRQVTVHSELAHKMDALAVLGGYALMPTPRFEVAGLAGASFVAVRRTFATDAAEQILVPPSTVPTTAIVTLFDDHFATWMAEASGLVFVTTRIGIIGGIRVQPIRLKEDIDGICVVPFVGAVWRIR